MNLVKCYLLHEHKVQFSLFSEIYQTEIPNLITLGGPLLEFFGKFENMYFSVSYFTDFPSYDANLEWHDCVVDDYIHENVKVLVYKILCFLFDHILPTYMNWMLELFADPSTRKIGSVGRQCPG